MRITIEPTSKIVELNGVPARIWEGRTEDGADCMVFVTRVAVSEGYPPSVHQKFQDALKETRAPSPEAQAYPLRLVL